MTNLAEKIENGYKIIRLNKFFYKCAEEYATLGYSDEIKPACGKCELRYKCLLKDHQKCLQANKYLQAHFSCVPEKNPNFMNVSIKIEWLNSSVRCIVDECERGIAAAKEVMDGRAKD